PPARIAAAFDNLIERDDVRPRLDDIRCPALIIHGELDATMPLPRAEDLCSRIPGCEGVFVVPGAGHTSNLENRDAFNEALRPLVAKHSEARRLVTYDVIVYATVADPYPLFDRLREQDPVFQTNFGYWYVSRYDDANRLLRDGSLGAGRRVPDSMGITSCPLCDLMPTWMMAIDGPEHTRVRKLVSRAFTPRAVEAMRPDVQAFADRRGDGLEAHAGGGP